MSITMAGLGVEKSVLAKRKISYLEKPLLDANIKDFAKMINKAAIKSKDVALSLAVQGVRGNITPKLIRTTLGNDIFDASGKMTKEAKKGILLGMINKGLPLDLKIKDSIDLFIKGMFS